MRPNFHSFISKGALVGLVGFVLSGPAGYGLVKSLYPQPPWTGPEVMVSHYHWAQDMPFYFGFLLIGGMLVVAAGHFLQATEEDRGLPLLSLSFTIVFASLIFFNYFVQITFVRNLVLNYQPQYDEPISEFSMNNPLSLCWGIEMWGYAILGVAMWMLAPFYKSDQRIRILLAVNGIMSCVGGILTAGNQCWVLTPAGFISYATWNILIIVLMVLIFLNARKQIN